MLPMSPEISYVTAKKWKRLLTLFIDSLVIIFLRYVTGILLNQNGWDDPIGFWLLNVLTFIYYYTISEATTGRTIGKLMAGTQIIQKDGSELDTNMALIRTLLRLIPVDPFTFLLGRRTGLHDAVSGTIVIDVKANVVPETRALYTQTSPMIRDNALLNASDPFLPAETGYKGDYNGGHNNFQTPRKTIERTPADNGGYCKGDLYK